MDNFHIPKSTKIRIIDLPEEEEGVASTPSNTNPTTSTTIPSSSSSPSFLQPSSSSSSASATEPSSSSSLHYTFEPYGKEWPSLMNNSTTKEVWDKWGLSTYRHVSSYRIIGTHKFDPLAIDSFLSDFFNNSTVRETLRIFPHRISNAQSTNGLPLQGIVNKVKYTPVRTTVTSMEFFDRLITEDIVLDGGYIKKTYENTIQGIPVSDLLRQTFLDPDNESGAGYSIDKDLSSIYTYGTDREEFIYQLMKYVLTGGEMCQYEDNWELYCQYVKLLYKDLITVTREENNTSGESKITVASYVYRIHGLEGYIVPSTGPSSSSSSSSVTPANSLVSTKLPFFPTTDEYNHSVCWLSIDPLRRTVSVFYHAWVSFW